MELWVPHCLVGFKIGIREGRIENQMFFLNPLFQFLYPLCYSDHFDFSLALGPAQLSGNISLYPANNLIQ